MVTFSPSSGDLSSSVELTCADNATLFYRNYEYLPVADLTRFCRGHDRVIDAIVKHDNLDSILGSRLTSYSLSRYTAEWPRWRP